jgi:hypothetical protein
MGACASKSTVRDVGIPFILTKKVPKLNDLHKNKLVKKRKHQIIAKKFKIASGEHLTEIL